MKGRVSMPSRAYTSFLLNKSSLSSSTLIHCFNALSGLYLISTRKYDHFYDDVIKVSMPSRAYTSFLRTCILKTRVDVQ